MQEVTVKRIVTQHSLIYSIPESIHLKECRLEEGNTLLFFTPSLVEWKRSTLLQSLPLMHSEADGQLFRSLRCSKEKDAGELK